MTILLSHIISGTYLPKGIYGDWLLFFVSARTNKRRHHQFVSDEIVTFCTTEKLTIQCRSEWEPLATSNSTTGFQCSLPMYPRDGVHRQQLISSPRRTSFDTRTMHHVRQQRPTNACDLHSQASEPLLLFLLSCPKEPPERKPAARLHARAIRGGGSQSNAI